MASPNKPQYGTVSRHSPGFRPISQLANIHLGKNTFFVLKSPYKPTHSTGLRKESGLLISLKHCYEIAMPAHGNVIRPAIGVAKPSPLGAGEGSMRR